MIPYGRQEIDKEDIESVIDVLKSDFITQGPAISLFEESVARYCNVDYGVALNSATSALHVACLALNLGEGDWLWTSPNSFVASANCALYCGAKVDFVDIDSKTYNMSSEALEKKLIKAEKEKKLPKIVIPVHFAGQSCDMERIHTLAKKYNFKIIEDASHAIGGRYMDRPIGDCSFSDITVFSFHPVKIITTAEGGIATTKSFHLYQRMQLLRSHGVTRNEELMTTSKEGDWFYQQVDLGFNYRMTDLQAALGISQLKKIDLFINKRRTLLERYNRKLSKSFLCPFQEKNSSSSIHLYPIQLPIEIDRKKVFNQLRKEGIGVNVHYIPIYKHPFYKRFGFDEKNFNNTNEYYSRAISLPIFPGLDLYSQDFIIKTLDKVIVKS